MRQKRVKGKVRKGGCICTNTNSLMVDRNIACFCIINDTNIHENNLR